MPRGSCLTHAECAAAGAAFTRRYSTGRTSRATSHPFTTPSHRMNTGSRRFYSAAAAAAAAAITPPPRAVASGGGGLGAAPSPSSAPTGKTTCAVPPRHRTHTHFLIDESTDLDWQLLTEAHRKHGVWRHVPPQLPPSTDAALEAWLNREKSSDTATAKETAEGAEVEREVRAAADDDEKTGPSHFPVRYARAQAERMRRRVPPFSPADTTTLITRATAARRLVRTLRAQREAEMAALASIEKSDSPAEGTAEGQTSVFTTATATPGATGTLTRVPSPRPTAAAASTPSITERGTPSSAAAAQAPAQVPDIHLLFLQHPTSPFSRPDDEPPCASPSPSDELQPWAYIPTHAPPPLTTTGTRSLLPLASFAPHSRSALHAAQLPTTDTATTTTTTTTQTVMRRAAVDTSMRFHCKECGKPFRLRENVLAHVRARHPSVAVAAADPSCLVGDGPGEGELLAFEDVAVTVVSAGHPGHTPPPPSTAATAAARENTTATATATARTTEAARTLMTVAQAYTDTPRVALPEDALVDELLFTVWDTVALARDDLAASTAVDPSAPMRFVPASSAVAANVDRRAEMEAAAALTTPARATPAGAAPGIKRRPTMAFSATSLTRVGEGRSAHPRTVVPLREQRKQYPNPFGDSPNAQVAEMAQASINPFMTREEEDAAGRDQQPPTEVATVAAPDARFRCPLCARAHAVGSRRRYCLLDAVLDHVETTHAAEGGLDALTPADWEGLYRANDPPRAQDSALSAASSSSSTPVSGTEDAALPAGASTLADTAAGVASSTTDTASATTSPTSSSSSGAPPPPTAAEPAHVHARTATNMIVIGVVRDVQHGFLGSEPVLQCVVETAVSEAPDTASSSSSLSAATESELIVVRCVGHQVPTALLRQQILCGTRVYACGLLKMNRHVDTASRRLHAYPYLQISPPLGILKAL